MILNWRYWLLGAIGTVAFLFLILTPEENDPHFLATLFVSKASAIALAVADIALYMWFVDEGELDEFIIDE